MSGQPLVRFSRLVSFRLLSVLVILSLLLPFPFSVRTVAEANEPPPETLTLSEPLSSATPTLHSGQAPTPTSVEGPEPTLTPLPSSAATDPSPYPDPGTELPPILELTATPTLRSGQAPTLEAGLELTPTAVLSGTLTLTPTLEAAPIPAQDSLLKLEIDDSLSTPGGSLYLSWQVAESVWKEGSLSLLVSVPPGFEILSGDGACTGCSEGEYDPTSGKFVIPLANPAGFARFAIPLDLPGPYPVQAELVEVQGDGKAALTLDAKDQLVDETGLTYLSVEDAAAGSATAAGLGGEVKLTVPKGVLEGGGAGEITSLAVRIRQPIPSNAPPDSLSGDPFEIVVSGGEQPGAEKTGDEIHEFKEPLLIEIPFGGGRDRSIFTYDPLLMEWLALPTEVDREAGVLRAYTSHLSIFDDDLNEWQMSEMPTLDTAQVSGQMGSSSYSYPIWMPPGPGGLQPSLSLSYNSAVVDGATSSLTQGGYLGLGWSLNTGYIERDMHGTRDAPHDDSYNLVLNGVSGTLLLGSDGKYHFQDRNFWRIELVGDIWTLWDKEGNKYTFGLDPNHRARYPRYGSVGNGCPYSEYIWKWGLSTVTNKFGQVLSYGYSKDTKTVKINPCPGKSGETKPVDIALYPQTITYPHQRYRALFTSASTLRTDYRSEWWTGSGTTVFFDRYRLQKIEIQHDPDGDVGPLAWSTVRTYTLNYNDDSGEIGLFNGFTWSSGGKTFAVQSISESGLNGLTRPVTTFTYGDEMHLTEVDNGYGGEASFSYETVPWSEAQVNENHEHITPKVNSCPDGWDGVSCVNGDLILGSGTATRLIGRNFQMGGVYELRMNIKNTTGITRNLKVKLKYKDGGTLTLIDQDVAGWTPVDVTTQVVLPMPVTRLSWEVTGSNFHIKKMETRQLLTRYRVEEKTLDGGITDEGTSQSYEYDGPATNDEAHSAAVAAGENYSSKYRSFRGHAASRVIGPTKDGLTRVDTSWYRQDDELNGRQVGGMTMLESYHTAFETSACGSGWTCYGNSSQPRIEGDQTLQATDLDEGWNTTLQPTGRTIPDRNSVVLQFRVTNPGVGDVGVLALESGTYQTNFNRFGVHLVGVSDLPNPPKLTLNFTYCDGQSCTSSPVLFSSGEFQAGKWYVLQLTRDDTDGFLLRGWQRERPDDVREYRLSRPTGLTWYFKAWANKGTLSLDEYSEGKVYSFNSTAYDPNYTEDVPVDTSEPFDYADLQIGWAPVVETASLSFEGGSLYLGQKSEMKYLKIDQNNSQYGNQTRQEDAWWDGDSWVKYRATRSQYYPSTAGGKYLTGLPGYQNVYDCPGGSCDYGIEDIVSSQTNLYDGASNCWTAPTYGWLTRVQTFVCFANSSGVCYDGYDSDPNKKQLYSDQALSYDSWGNTVSATTYNGYGELGVPASSGGRSSLAGYDPTYHTYLVSQTSPLTSTMTTKSYMGYDYALGLPNLQIDPNGGVSTVTYDGLGSPTELRVEGDEAGRASIGAGYFLSWQPMMVDLQQKVVQNEVAQTYNLRKFYDGRGRLIQQQTAKAKLADNACSTDSNTDQDECDIVVDSWFSGNGLEQRQSVPYALSYWYNGKPNEPNPYRGQRIEPGETNPVPYTTTELDLLGRAVQMTAPDETTTQTTYAILIDTGGPYQQTCVTDAKNNTTCTRTDSRGRTVEVDPPEGPGVAYTYDAADRLKTASMGGAETELWYDYAGRKTKMDDADMGFWQYGYNALSQLKTQTDARGCQTNLNYDLAGRLSSKTYNVSGCTGVPATASVTNTYDGILHWQPFDSWPSTDWVKLGNVNVVGGDGASDGELKLTGNGSWGTTYAYRTGNLKDGQAVRFSFKVDDVYIESNITVDRGTWGGADYRSWTLRLEGGYLKREYYQGTAYYKTNLMALKANTWYEGVLAIDGSDPNAASSSYPPRFRVVVWERDNPNVWAQNRMSFATNWSYSDWKFVTQVKTNTKSLYLDNVQEYDDGAIGQRSKMIDGSGNTEWTYTSRGQVQSEKKTIGSDVFLTQYGYHPDGSVRWMQYPDNEKLTYLYHAQKAPSSLQTNLEGGLYYLSNVSFGDVYYNSTSERYILHKLGNDGLQLKQTFFAWSTPNGNGRLKQITAGTTGTPTSLLDLRYYTGTNTPAYDEVGNILNIYDYKTASPQTQTFTYDDLYRLLTASAIGGTEGTYSETYTYDSNTGNLASKTGMGTYTYGSSDHAHAVTATSGKSYGYDANGNQITRVIGSITYTLSYDVENRLVSVSWAIGSTNHSMAFVFDGDGNRVKSTLDGTTTTFAGTHYEVTGSAVTKYYYSGASRIAMRSSIGVRYIFGDHLGSASVTADMYGSSVTRQLYKPYGETRSSGSVPTKYTFTGQYSYSTEIGLMYYVARFFDPQLGRFLSADTIVPQMWNSLSWDRYLYVFGNALRYTDPSGHNPTCMIATDDGYCVKWSDGRKQDPFAEYRPVLSEEIIRKIMLNVLAESQMGIYPDKVLAYTTWALINRYRNPDEYDEPLTNGYIELLKLFKGSWEAAYNAYSSKGNGFYDAFSNVKKIVMDVYHQYLGGHDDPTNGAISFSHSNKLTRDVIVNGEVIRTDTFQDFNDVEQWMRDMAARKKHKESYFYYLIVQFTCIERSGAEKTVIFYVGNDECASTGNCGVGYPPLPKKEK